MWNLAIRGYRQYTRHTSYSWFLCLLLLRTVYYALFFFLLRSSFFFSLVLCSISLSIHNTHTTGTCVFDNASECVNIKIKLR